MYQLPQMLTSIERDCLGCLQSWWGFRPTGLIRNNLANQGPWGPQKPNWENNPCLRWDLGSYQLREHKSLVACPAEPK